MSAVFGVLLCLSPLLLLAAGYYVGRYGSPVVLRFNKGQDRRRRPATAAAIDEYEESDSNAPALVVYRPFENTQSGPPARTYD